MSVPASYNLNAGQQAAADAFFEFLFSSDKEFIISGAAGVGKTYLMSYIIDNTMPRYHEMCKLIGVKPEYINVEMTATTNKAADVLAQATRRPTSTVHSFFNLRVHENYDTGQTVIRKTVNWMVHDRKIIFIDEASMIDSELWKVLQEGTANCKLVYVGDHNQLAPVHEDISPIYKQKSPFFELTEPMRNAGQPALMAVCQQLRETVATGIFKPLPLVHGVIDYLDGPTMQQGIDFYFRQPELNGSARVLAFTNKRVIQYNDHIRALRQLPDTFQKGEKLIMNNAYKQGKRIVPVETLVTIQNAGRQDELMIDDDHPEIKLKVNYADIVTELGDRFHDVAYPADRAHFDSLVKYYKRTKNWALYYYLRNDLADLRPSDASTVHKAQGSTYDAVFVDLGDISTCRVPNQAARMLYVAFSRARKRVFLYGALADKYGGLAF